MSTADNVRERALILAEAGPTTDQAVEEVLAHCKGRRVPVVLAHQRLVKDLEERASDPVVARAAHLLDQVLERLPLE